jgi:hypothetical protein
MVLTIGVGHIDRVNRHPTEQGDGAEHVGVSSIGFGVLTQVTPQRTNPLSLNPDGFDPGHFEPVCDREPRHSGRFHYGSDGALCRQPFSQSSHQAAEAVGR